MDYRHHKGERQRRRDRRRKLKMAAVLALMFFLAMSGSWMAPRKNDAPVTPSWMVASASNLAYARNIYRLLGAPVGEAKIYLDRWPQYADYIMGLVDEVNLG